MLNTKKLLAWDSKNLHTIWTVNFVFDQKARPTQLSWVLMGDYIVLGSVSSYTLLSKVVRQP
jgi:hypothetical protein